ncbi:MAG: metallophosphoesterase [Myxococcales bacterium]|nr:metallophosphoesterase [Myxococcales bacterium]
MAPRLRILPDHGTLLVSTDLHGNWGDFDRLRRIFLDLRDRADDPASVHWASLGDLVHGPSDKARKLDPVRFGYPDQSPELVEAFIALRERYPDNFHVVLGNHDHGHIGGPHTRKFHPDEVAFLEQRMQPEAIARMHALFRGALLALAAPCGLVFCHGSPDDNWTDLDQLDAIDPASDDLLSAEPARPELRAVLQSMLTCYGQPGEITAELLQQISRPGLELRVVVHGHDVDTDGWYAEHGNQVCPVLFGAPPNRRRYLLLDLGAHYRRAEDLREGIEVLRLYPDMK